MKKHVQARRARNLELGKADAAMRCASCKRALPKVGVQMRWNDPRMFCSVDCLKDAEARR